MPPDQPPRPPDEPTAATRVVAPGDPVPPPVDPVVDDDHRAASLGELRSLRRWLAVAGIWAVAASAIAIIALLEARDDEPARDPAAVTGRQLAEVRREFDNRIDRLEERVQGLPDSGDVSKLEGRLKKVEEAASEDNEDASQLNDRIDDLEQRVEQAEQQSDDNPSGDNGATTTP